MSSQQRLSLEKFAEIVAQPGTVKIDFKPRPPMKQTPGVVAAPQTCDYIDVRIQDPESKTIYKPEFLVIELQSGRVKTPEERGQYGVSATIMHDPKVKVKENNKNKIFVEAMINFNNQFRLLVEEALAKNIIVAKNDNKLAKDIKAAATFKVANLNICKLVTTEHDDATIEPFFRLNFATDKNDKNKFRSVIYDAGKPKYAMVKDPKDPTKTIKKIVGYELATTSDIFDENGNILSKGGEIYNATNLHEFVTAGSLHSGTVCCDSVCFSAQGISIPVKIKDHVIARGTLKNDGLGRTFDDNDLAAISAVSDEQEIAAVMAGPSIVTSTNQPSSSRPAGTVTNNAGTVIVDEPENLNIEISDDIEDDLLA